MPRPPRCFGSGRRGARSAITRRPPSSAWPQRPAASSPSWRSAAATMPPTAPPSSSVTGLRTATIVFDEAMAVWESYAIPGQPAGVLLDRQGREQARWLGAFDPTWRSSRRRSSRTPCATAPPAARCALAATPKPQLPLRPGHRRRAQDSCPGPRRHGLGPSTAATGSSSSSSLTRRWGMTRREPPHPRLVRVRLPRALQHRLAQRQLLVQEALGERAEEVRARDDAGHPAVVDDGDDQHAVVEEDLGDLGVGEVACRRRRARCSCSCSTGSSRHSWRFSSASSRVRVTKPAYLSSLR